MMQLSRLRPLASSSQLAICYLAAVTAAGGAQKWVTIYPNSIPRNERSADRASVLLLGTQVRLGTQFPCPLPQHYAG
jgi:hypothetical protein